MSLTLATLLLLFSTLGWAQEANFLDLYFCDEKWEEINGRPGYRILDCNASAVKKSDSCTGANFICFGIVPCHPKPGVKFPDGLDPDFIGADYDYEAACHARSATECKSPLECVRESMEKNILSGGGNPLRNSRGRGGSR